ncbi:MAG TPA: hypothetical protein VKK81_00930 [Candidatus Binatia bacterium]|nr:hypothetical protein [Candidatus Binatia bacterium]
MTELSPSVLVPLWEDGEFILSRAERDGDRSPLLVETECIKKPGR